MQGLGRHVLAEVYGCGFDILNDLDGIRMTSMGSERSWSVRLSPPERKC